MDERDSLLTPSTKSSDLMVVDMVSSTKGISSYLSVIQLTSSRYQFLSLALTRAGDILNQHQQLSSIKTFLDGLQLLDMEQQTRLT